MGQDAPGALPAKYRFARSRLALTQPTTLQTGAFVGHPALYRSERRRVPQQPATVHESDGGGARRPRDHRQAPVGRIHPWMPTQVHGEPALHVRNLSQLVHGSRAG